MGWLKSDIVYCSNVHPGSSISSLKEQIYNHAIPIKKARNLEKMSLGLWFNESSVTEFINSFSGTEEFVNLLVNENLTIMTLNAFPQQQFHGGKVKARVYKPNWSSKERLNYTLSLLSLIEEHPHIFHSRITISTLPLGYKSEWDNKKHKLAIDHLCILALKLSQLEERTGIHVRVCLEMEPDCVLEKTQDIIDFFYTDLYKNFKNKEYIKSHLGICFDICHQAVMHENIEHSLQSIIESEICIGKIQVSNALRFKEKEAEGVIPLLKPFFNSPYLHQMKIKSYNSLKQEMKHFPDINEAVLSVLTGNGEARVHFHVPIYKDEISTILKTTQQSIIDTIDFFKNSSLCPHLEIETYTWSVFDAKAINQSLNDSLVLELEWLENQLYSHDLLQG